MRKGARVTAVAGDPVSAVLEQVLAEPDPFRLRLLDGLGRLDR